MTPEQLTTLAEIARDAAKLVLEVYGAPFRVDYKGPDDPVTAADRTANDFICRRLAQAFPGIPVVAEENDPETFEDFRRHERVLFVDPLDGTRDFVQRNDEFVVMIAMVEGDRSMASVVHAPVPGLAWVGLVGHGAFRLNPSGTRTRVHVSNTAELAAARVLSSRSQRTPELERALATLGAGELSKLGSAGLKGARVAEGQAEGYVAPYHAGYRWDVCAVDALVHAAGGRVSDAHGNAIDYRAPGLVQNRGLVATNGMVHQTMLERLAQARQQTPPQVAPDR